MKQISNQLQITPIVALLGPRQCGKTTLAKQYANSLRKGIEVTLFDLMRLKNPKLALEPLSGLIIIDGIQKSSKSC